MKTFESIRDTVAKQLYGYEDYEQCLKEGGLVQPDNVNREAGKEYAKACCIATLQKGYEIHSWEDDVIVIL